MSSACSAFTDSLHIIQFLIRLGPAWEPCVCHSSLTVYLGLYSSSLQLNATQPVCKGSILYYKTDYYFKQKTPILNIFVVSLSPTDENMNILKQTTTMSFQITS
jgi:hypothetical protein